MKLISKIREKRKFCGYDSLNNPNHYQKNIIREFFKFVNESIKSNTKKRTEYLTYDNNTSFLVISDSSNSLNNTMKS